MWGHGNDKTPSGPRIILVMALGRKRAGGWGQQNLAELQPFCMGISPWFQRAFDVQNDLGSKDQQEMGLLADFFFPSLLRPDPQIILNWIIHPPTNNLVQNSQIAGIQKPPEFWWFVTFHGKRSVLQSQRVKSGNERSVVPGLSLSMVRAHSHLRA